MKQWTVQDSGPNDAKAQVAESIQGSRVEMEMKRPRMNDWCRSCAEDRFEANTCAASVAQPLAITWCVGVSACRSSPAPSFLSSPTDVKMDFAE